MRIHVLTDAKGEVIATARPAADHIHLRIQAGEQQKAYEIDVPDHVGDLRGDALHAKVAEHLRQKKT